MTIENRTRVPSGVRTGGQFAAEVHAEAAGVTLEAPPVNSDQAVLSAVGDLARTNANFQLADWKRRTEGPYHLYNEVSPDVTEPERLVLAVERAKSFETLAREDQEQLLDAVKLSGVKHLLEPGQKLGTDRIQVAEGLELQDANLAMVLTAQAEVHKADLPGTVTLTGIGDVATFEVQDGGIRHELRVGSGLIGLSAEDEEGDPYVRGDWLWRAGQSVYGGSILEGDRSSDLASYYAEYRKYAVLMDAMAASPLKGAGDEIGELDLERRTAVLRSDGSEFVLDFSGDAPTMRTEEGKQLHPSMVAGYLDHIAKLADRPDGATFASDLPEVFRETDRRLVR